MFVKSSRTTPLFGLTHCWFGKLTAEDCCNRGCRAKQSMKNEQPMGAASLRSRTVAGRMEGGGGGGGRGGGNREGSRFLLLLLLFFHLPAA